MKFKLTRLKRLLVFKAAHRLTVFAQFHRNLKLLLQYFCKILEGSARYCKILHVIPDLRTVILMLNSSNTSLLYVIDLKDINDRYIQKKKGMATLLSCAMPF